MTQTNTDYLLQLNTAVTDRTYGVPAANDGADKFDDHLSQAATFAGDDFLSRGNSLQRTDSDRYGGNDTSWTTSGSKQNDHNSRNSTSSSPSPAERDDSLDAVRDSRPAADDSDVDSHETNESDDSTAAEVAGASQAATNNTKKDDSKTESKTNADSAVAAKPAAINKKATTEAGDSKAKANPDGRASNSTLPEVVTQHAAEAAELAEKTATPTTDENAGESQATVSEGKRSKTAKSGTPAAKANKDDGVNTSSPTGDDSPVDAAGDKQISSEVAQKANVDADSTATAADGTKSKSKSDSDETADDDSRTHGQNDVRAKISNDAADSTNTNKVAAAQLAAVTPSATDAGTNGESKGKDNDRAIKPVVAKGEPVAAAFARMTRNSVAGSNDSTAGASDLPQVDPSRFIGRVAKAFQTAQDRGGTLQLRLSPPELGALRIELNVKDGVMSASLQTENANARKLLLDHLPALRDRLAEQNIRVDRFDVDVRQESSGRQTDARGSQQQQFQNQPDQSTPRRQAQPQQRMPETATPEKAMTVPSVSDTGLNLIV